MRLFTALEDIERIAYHVGVSGEGSLKVVVEGGDPSCCLCGVGGHVEYRVPNVVLRKRKRKRRRIWKIVGT